MADGKGQAEPEGLEDLHLLDGLAFAYLELGDMEQAQKHFQMVLDMPASEELRALARDGLRRIAVRELKARWPRMDAVFYLLDALRLFRGKSLEEVREIAFEIGMLGQYDMAGRERPQGRTSCGLLAREGFIGRWSCCASCTLDQAVRAGDGHRMDLGEVWGMAEGLRGEEGRS